MEKLIWKINMENHIFFFNLFETMWTNTHTQTHMHTFKQAVTKFKYRNSLVS